MPSASVLRPLSAPAVSPASHDIATAAELRAAIARGDTVLMLAPGAVIELGGTALNVSVGTNLTLQAGGIGATLDAARR